MGTIDNKLSREKLSCNSLFYNKLQEAVSSNIEYCGIIGHTYSRDRGEIAMKKPSDIGI